MIMIYAFVSLLLGFTGVWIDPTPTFPWHMFFYLFSGLLMGITVKGLWDEFGT